MVRLDFYEFTDREIEISNRRRKILDSVPHIHPLSLFRYIDMNNREPNYSAEVSEEVAANIFRNFSDYNHGKTFAVKYEGKYFVGPNCPVSIDNVVYTAKVKDGIDMDTDDEEIISLG